MSALDGGAPRMNAPLPSLSPALRELVETLWAHARPLTTRQLQDATARRHPQRAGRKINSTSSLLESLVAAGWVTGDKRGGGRWRWRAALTRHEGLERLATIAVEDFSRNPRDSWYLIQAALGGALLDLVRRNPGPAGGERQPAGTAPAAGSNRSR